MQLLSFTAPLRVVLVLLALLLAGATLAFAQGDVAAETETVPLPEPWPEDTLHDELSNVDWNYTLYLPAGGVLLSEADVGIENDEDPLTFPLIWTPGSSPVVVEAVMLGCFDNGEPIDEAQFKAILEAENGNVNKDFPGMLMAPEDIPLVTGIFSMVTMYNAEQDIEVTKFSTYGANIYYSLSFIYPRSADSDTVLSQMFAITESFGPYYVADELESAH